MTGEGLNGYGDHSCKNLGKEIRVVSEHAPPGEFDPRYYLKPAREAMQAVVRARMETFGQAGHAGD